jgi:hypothetical protein
MEDRGLMTDNRSQSLINDIRNAIVQFIVGYEDSFWLTA